MKDKHLYEGARIYCEEDYRGEFNLLAAEKELIIRAYKRHYGLKTHMAKSLEIHLKHLHRKIYQHDLDI